MNGQSGCPCPEAGATTGRTTAQSDCATRKKGADRASTSREEANRTHPLQRLLLSSQTRSASARSIVYFWDGREREPTGREWKRGHVRRSGPIGLRQQGGHRRRQEDGTRRRATEPHTISIAAGLPSFSLVDEAAVCTCCIRHCVF